MNTFNRVRIGTQDRNLETGTEAETNGETVITSLPRRASQLASSITQDHTLREVTPLVSCFFTHQSLIKKMLHRFV